MGTVGSLLAWLDDLHLFLTDLLLKAVYLPFPVQRRSHDSTCACFFFFFFFCGREVTSGKLSLQALCNANGSCRLVFPGVVFYLLGFFLFLLPKD